MTTTDDVIRLAIHAGIPYAKVFKSEPSEVKDVLLWKTSEIARLITLAKAEEREACIAACEAIEEEYQRRESGKWQELKSDAQTGASDCAAAIRARNKEQA